MAEADKYIVGPNGEKRLKGVQLAIPVITGTIAFSLGKKASDTATHKWTVYTRSPTGEDMTHIFKKITFKLHNSFSNPNRDLAYPPYELTESGWGEFDIGIEFHFHEDATEPPLEVYHHLQLGLDAHGNAQKKPHLYEVFEEIVFWEPTEAFYDRVKAHQALPAPGSQLAQYFGKFDPAMDYMRVQNARKRLAPVAAMVKAQLAAAEGEGGEAERGGDAVAAPMEQG